MSNRTTPTRGLSIFRTLLRIEPRPRQRIANSFDPLAQSGMALIDVPREPSRMSSVAQAAGSSFSRSKRRRMSERWARSFVAFALRLAIRCVRRGWDEQAVSILSGLLMVAPNATIARILLARAALRVFDERAARDAIRSETIVPEASRYFARIAGIHLALEECDAAAHYLTQAQRFFPESTIVWHVLGVLADKRGDVDEAVRCFRTRAEFESTHRTKVAALWAAAERLSEAGREHAVACYRELLDLAPDNLLAYERLLDCLNVRDPTDPLVEKAREFLSSPKVDLSSKSHLHYAVGHVYDRHGDAAAAFAHFSRANALRAIHNPPYPPIQMEVDARCAAFTQDMIASLSQSGCPDPLLVCIVGMPRSGTTLVEQLLNAHSNVHALGERTDFQALACGELQRVLKSKLSYPRCCSALTADAVRRLSSDVRERLQRLAGPCHRIVTKLPADCFDLGLIRIFFPKATIIHCMRNPIDTCLSCYMQDFAYIPYATDLAQLAVTYRAYQHIMRHWQSVLPPPTICEVRYEELTSDPATAVRAICAHCELPFESSCLHFHRRSTQVKTASRWQVRRPIYTSSVGRADRYREFLGPLLSLEASPSDNRPLSHLEITQTPIPSASP
jgi:tetratricopeptide (TPR) repeat protein